MAKTKKGKIKSDLMAQMSKKGIKSEHINDLINDYMEMWDAKNNLIKDIKERGVAVEYVSNAGVRNIKKNDSVGEFLKVNAQMAKLLDSLGLNPAQLEAEEDEEM